MSWLPALRCLHGLVAAFIGGGAGTVTSSITAAALAPESFNLTNQVRPILLLMLITFSMNGLLSSMFYLKQSPVPDWDGTERRGAREDRP